MSVDNEQVLTKTIQEVEQRLGISKTNEILGKVKAVFDSKRGSRSFLDPLEMRPVLEEVFKVFYNRQPTSEDINRLVKAMAFSKDGKITITEISMLGLLIGKAELFN